MGDRNRVFISYSHKDVKWFDAVREQMAVLQAEGRLSMCDDTQLAVGEDWAAQLNEMMLTARLGMLLISAPFLASKFVREQEVPQIFDRHEQGGMKIYPLLVRPCPWKEVPWLARLQLRPQDARRQAKPLSAFEGAARDQVLVDVATEVATLLG